jgi:hypothetical protein
VSNEAGAIVQTKLILLVAILLAFPAGAQTSTGKTEPERTACQGLHAGIRAQIIPPYTEEPSVALSLIVLNDSEKVIDAQPQSWRIEIDGKELDEMDTQQIFGNGVTPSGTWWLLEPGQMLEFVKSLSITRYLLPNGQHKVRWKGADFQSPTITVTITPKSH